MRARRNSGLKEEGGVGSHFMMVGQYLREPFVEFCYPTFAFRMLHQQPVAVQIKPIVIGTSARPVFIKFPALRVGNQYIFTFMDICPVCKAIQSIRVNTGVNQNNSIL